MQRVLIVEDEQHLAEGLRFNLEAEGYAAEIVDTGEAALERLVRKPSGAFDLGLYSTSCCQARTDLPWSPSCARRGSSCPC